MGQVVSPFSPSCNEFCFFPPIPLRGGCLGAGNISVASDLRIGRAKLANVVAELALLM